MGSGQVQREAAGEAGALPQPFGPEHVRSDRLRGRYRAGGTTPLNLFPLSNSVNKTTHGATTPLLLADWWVRYLTKPGDIVLDPFSGTGTMGVAALQSGRSYLGFETVEEYHLIAKGRLEKVALEKPPEKPMGEAAGR